MRRLGQVLAAMVASAVATTGTAFADDTKKSSTWDNWYNAAIQYGYTWSANPDFLLGYGSGSQDRHQIRLELQNTWKYGENYLFVDGIGSSSKLGDPGFNDGTNWQGYAVLNSNLSVQKVLGLQRGLFDVAVEGRGEISSFFNYSAFAYGASLYLNIPGFVSKPGDKIQFTYWKRYKDDDFTSSIGFNDYAPHDMLGITLRKEWEMGGLRWQHQTFFRYQLEEPKTFPTHFKDPERIFWESELFAYLTNNLSVGFRSEYFYDHDGMDLKGTKSDWRPIFAIKYDLGRSD